MLVGALSLLVLMLNGGTLNTMVMRVTSLPPNTCLDPQARSHTQPGVCLDHTHTAHLYLGRLTVGECVMVTYEGARVLPAGIVSAQPAACGAP